MSYSVATNKSLFLISGIKKCGKYMVPFSKVCKYKYSNSPNLLINNEKVSLIGSFTIDSVGCGNVVKTIQKSTNFNHEESSKKISTTKDGSSNIKCYFLSGSGKATFKKWIFSQQIFLFD